MMKQIITIIILLFTSNLFSQYTGKIPPEKPKLIIGIVIEQMRFDYIYRFWDKFDNGGFKRLLGEGTNCKNTNINYLYPHTASGIASINTGTTPSYNGIVANKWYLPLKTEDEDCVFDSNSKTTGSMSKNGKCSPKKLLTSTISDEILLSTRSKSKVIGVSLNSYSSILSVGHAASAAYWFDTKKGKWITSSYYLKSLPDWVKEFNNNDYPDLYLSREWATTLPIEKYTESLPDDNEYEKGILKNQTTFPYQVGEFYKENKDFNLLSKTPYGNTITKDFAISAIVNEQLGKDEFTDYLSVTFNTIENIGLLYGPSSVEIEDLFIRLDRELAHFLKFIDDFIGKQNTLIYLTSTSGVSENIAYLKEKKMPSGKFKNFYALALLKSYLNAIYGEGEWVLAYNNQQVYLNRDLIEKAKISLTEIQTKAANFLLQFSGIENAVSSTTLQTTDFTKGIFEKMQNSFNQKRSGDILISLGPGWIQDVPYVTDHNTAYSYDSHIPLIWYGWKIGKQNITRPINIIDIAPTISMMLNISLPNGNTGIPIYELLK